MIDLCGTCGAYWACDCPRGLRLDADGWESRVVVAPGADAVIESMWLGGLTELVAKALSDRTEEERATFIAIAESEARMPAGAVWTGFSL